MSESKKCNYCGCEYLKKDFPKIFHRMITCGKIECINQHKKTWTFNNICPDCGKPISRAASHCKRCSLIGIRNPFYGKTHTEESKKKIRLFSNGHIPWIKGKTHSEHSKIKNSVAHQHGELKPLHYGTNLRNAVRHSLSCIKWRTEVFKRDNYTCKKCRIRGGAIEAHHKISFGKLVKEAIKSMPSFSAYDACILYAPLWNIDNGTTLCKTCHRFGKGNHKWKNKK